MINNRSPSGLRYFYTYIYYIRNISTLPSAKIYSPPLSKGDLGGMSISLAERLFKLRVEIIRLGKNKSSLTGGRI